MPTEVVGWGGLISFLLSYLLPHFSLFAAHFSSGMSLYEGQCIKAEKLFAFMLLIHIPAVR